MNLSEVGLVVKCDFSATQKCLNLEKCLFPTKKKFIFVFMTKNTILKPKMSWADICKFTHPLTWFCLNFIGLNSDFGQISRILDLVLVKISRS